MEPIAKLKDLAHPHDLAVHSPRRYIANVYDPKPSLGFDIPTLCLFPLEVGIAYALSVAGLPPLFITAAIIVTGILFAYRQSLSVELATRLLTRLIVRIFFRDLDSRNSHKIPMEGPVVFVCAPHANQFLDPAVVTEFVPRPISFIIAAKSYRQKIVGALARAQRSIPVERAQDLARPGTGTVTASGTTVVGTGTAFTTEFQTTDSILIAGEIIPIAKIVSDTEMQLKHSHPDGDISKPSSYKIVPKLDHRDVFKHVWETLAAGECIGIFPEGGSHDRTTLLPLKAGVAIMSLGAAAMYPGLNVRIVAVGLNYFHGHRFRGRVYVEFGDPFSLPQELIEQYKLGGSHKIEACNALLDRIREELKAVTVSAESWDQLQMLWAVRRLYQPTGVRLSTKETVVLIRRLAENYEKVKDNQDVKALSQEVREYNQLLRDYGLRDHQVLATTISRPRAALLLIYRVLLLIVYLVLAIPGLILNLPIAIITRTVSRKKANEALKASNVKVQAKDVLASWKVLTFLMIAPLVFVVYPLLVAFAGWMLGFSPLKTWGNFAVLQPFMMYFSVRMLETWTSIVRSIRPLFLVMTDVTGYYGEFLIVRRQTLKTQVRAMIVKYGQQLYGPAFRSLQFFDEKGKLRKEKVQELDSNAVDTSKLSQGNGSNANSTDEQASSTTSNGSQKSDTAVDHRRASFLERRQQQVAALAKRTTELVSGAVVGGGKLVGSKLTRKTVNRDFLRQVDEQLDAHLANLGTDLFDENDVLGQPNLQRSDSTESIPAAATAAPPAPAQASSSSASSEATAAQSAPVTSLGLTVSAEDSKRDSPTLSQAQNADQDLESMLSPGVEASDLAAYKARDTAAADTLDVKDESLPEAYHNVLASLEPVTAEEMAGCLSPKL